ncbi:MAG: dihydroneopterin aldolase [Gemmatimonadaceae bacterium]|nr:dihydroneopterin aldolase [Gemmatimonadaceae bacterium]
MPQTVEITLRNMRFHVCVGILPHEGELAQPLEVDLTAWVTGAISDGAGIDYRDLHAVASGVVSRSPLRFLETIAAQIAEDALARPNVVGARVAVRKPHVALAGPLDYVEVVVEHGARA